jgi:hypothetical protein
VKRLLALVCLLVAVGLTACGSSATKTVTVTTAKVATSATNTAATTTASVTPTTATVLTPTTSSTTTGAVTPVVHHSAFRSPSGNIGCVIIDGIARCDVRHRSWSPPRRPANCPSEVDFGQGLEVSGSRPGAIVCAGDTTLDPTAPAVAFGSDDVVGGFRCASSTSGMICTKIRTGHGFFVSNQSYRTF